MALYPRAVLKLLPENKTQARIDPDQAILHSAVDAPGPTSLYGYFSRADVTVESHFFVRNDGTVEQYMDTNVRADANYKANGRAISIETEDDGDPNRRPWNSAQVRAILELLDWICDTHPKVLRRQCPSWDAPGIGWHSMWGAPSPWTPVKGKTCPGTIRVPQAKEIIAAIARGGKGNDEVPTWAKEAWAWATGRGLIKDERPNDPITRAEAIVVLHRIHEAEGVTPSWAANGYKLFKGLIDHPKPNAPLTESRFVTLLERVKERLK